VSIRPTLLAIREADITSGVCRRCAACCQVTIQVAGADARYRKFLREVGLELVPPPRPGKDDCCDDAHAVTVKLGPCRHLVTGLGAGGEPSFGCAVYEDVRRPQLCADFNCVSWAKTNNTYTMDNQLIVRAQQVWKSLRASRAGVAEELPCEPPREEAATNFRQ
jgi:hypothetical protein